MRVGDERGGDESAFIQNIKKKAHFTVRVQIIYANVNLL
jgi:hypothetical protein